MVLIYDKERIKRLYQSSLRQMHIDNPATVGKIENGVVIIIQRLSCVEFWKISQQFFGFLFSPLRIG